MDSVSSRDIKRAASRLQHLPGFLLCFLWSHFFLRLLRYVFSMSNQSGYHFSTVESIVGPL